MTTAVICISHSEGADGEAIGRLVADRVGFRYVDDTIVVAAAQSQGLLGESVSQAESRHAGRTLEVDFGRFEQTETLRELIRAEIDRTATDGNVVIVAHAASYALTGRDGVLRVLVTASDDIRAARIAGAEKIGARQAGRVRADSDKGRAVYLRRFYGVKTERPTDYDLVVNTDTLTTSRAADIVVAAATS